MYTRPTMKLDGWDNLTFLEMLDKLHELQIDGFKMATAEQTGILVGVQSGKNPSLIEHLKNKGEFQIIISNFSKIIVVAYHNYNTYVAPPVKFKLKAFLREHRKYSALKGNRGNRGNSGRPDLGGKIDEMKCARTLHDLCDWNKNAKIPNVPDVPEYVSFLYRAK